jgi:plastocyanin
MTRLFIALGIAATSLALLAGTSRAATPALNGTVGPGFTIKLTQNGKAVTSLKAGTYNLVVHDKADIHDFVVEGPGVEREVTSVPFKGTKTVQLKLRAGKYKFYCRPHEPVMFGFLTVK